jgi:iron(III) transport system ATP-binding protein
MNPSVTPHTSSPLPPLLGSVDTEEGIHCESISKSYGTERAVSELSLTATPGEITALLGPSGCGKTTTLRLIAGLETPDEGSIQIEGRTVADDRKFVAPEKRRVGIVFQDYALFPHLDVRGNIAYALPQDGQQGRLDRLLGLVGLTSIAERMPHELSGGQQQRVALARALASNPQAILLDEPFSSLDASLREQMRSEVRQILKEAGVTTVFVTHDQEEAMSIADRIAVMRDGRVVQSGTPEEVYGSPIDRWTAEFLGEADVLPGIALGDEVECELGPINAATSFCGPAQVVIRPESIDLSPLENVCTGFKEATVLDRTFFGHDQLVEVELDSGLRLRSRRLGYPVWNRGDRVGVRVDGPVTVLPAE